MRGEETDRWLVRADTGGTIADLWAIGPDDGQRRTKVLSSGALRLRVETPGGGGWGAPDPGFVRMGGSSRNLK